MKTSTSLLRALFLYHLAEYQSGNATTIRFDIQDNTFKISDNGRGHAISRTINDIPYLRLVYSQFEYPFDKESDTPIQLHTIGMSLIHAFCEELTVTVHKKENTYLRSYKHGKLDQEEMKENRENVTGTALEGRFNSQLVHEELDLQDMEQWLAKIRSIHGPLKLIFNNREL